MDIQSIKNLLDELDAYSKETPGEVDFAAFGAWLQRRYSSARRAFSPPPDAFVAETTESIIAKYIVFLNRYAKGYVKKLLDGSPLGSLDEFVFLIRLLRAEKATKTELIEQLRLEKPTGTEVLRRLLQLGFLVEEGHESDKRSKNLRLTELGKTELFKVLGRFRQFSALLTGNLEDAEKTELLRLLQKLEDFHLPLRVGQRGTGTWGELLVKAGLA